MTLANTKCKYWIPAALWAGFIFYLSTLQGVDLPAFPYSDKIAHLSIYVVLGYFVMMAMTKAHNAGAKRAVMISVMIVVVYGVLDEFHQTFVPTRTAEVLDLLSDAVGGTIGSLVYSLKRR